MRDQQFIDNLPTADWDQLDKWIQRFEEAWESGAIPKLEDFVPASTDLRSAALVELIGIDLEYRFKKGWQPRIEAYFSTFLELTEDQDALLSLLLWEYRLRKSNSQLVTIEEYQQRFPKFADLLPQKFSTSHASQPLVRSQDTPNHPSTTDVRPSLRANNIRRANAPRKEPQPAPEIPGYVIGDELGRGGMGVVYRARHLELNRDVALKMIRGGAHAGDEEIARFVSEAEAVAALHHPNIVQIFDVGRNRDVPYMALEFVDGGNLHDKISQSALEPGAAAEIVEQLARAINVAHQAGVVHRDLKPANILMTQDGTAKITDFGLAKRVKTTANGNAKSASDMTQSGAVLGTPAYMAPEQAHGNTKRVGPAVDVYALGGVLYSCLTRRPPFQADTPYETVAKVLDEEPTPPCRVNPQIPYDLETICLKCLAKDPSKRFPSAEALADDLSRFRAGKPIQARPVGRAERIVKWIRRRPAIAALLCAVFLVALAGIAGVAWSYQETVAEWRRAEKNADEANNAKIEADGAKVLALAREKEARLAENKEKEARKKAEDAKADSDRKRERIERLLYASQIARAQQEWRLGNAELARELLKKCDPKLRGWEYDFLWTKFYQGTYSIPSHHARLTFGVDCDICPDRKLIATIGPFNSPNLVKIWNYKSWPSGEYRPRETRTFYGLFGNSKAVALSDDGRLVAGAAVDNAGQLLSGSNVIVWDIESERELKRFRVRSEVHCLRIHPKHKHIAIGCRGGLFVWDLETGKAVPTFRGYSSGITGVRFNSAGDRLATSSWDGTVRIWEFPAGKQLFRLDGHRGVVESVGFSRDARFLASGGRDDLLKIWDVATGQELRTLRGHPGKILGVEFSPDGSHLASVGLDRATKNRDKTIILWNTRTGQETLVLRSLRGVTGVHFSPDGKQLITNDSIVVKLWPLELNANVITLRGHSPDGVWADSGGVADVAYSPNGARIATASSDKTAKIWDVATGQELLTLTGHRPPLGGSDRGDVRGVGFLDGGKRIITASGDRTLKLWDSETGKDLQTVNAAVAGGVRAMAVSPDGKHVASTDMQRLTLWAIGNGKLKRVRAHQAIGALRFSPDGKRYMCFGNKLIAWSTKTGKQLFSLDAKGTKDRCGAFSPSGKSFAVGQDNLVAIHNSESGEVFRVLKGHTDSITAIDFSPDGKRIVTGSRDRTLKLWHAETGEEILTLRGHDDIVTSVAFSPNGRGIVSGSNDRTAKIWYAGVGAQLSDLLRLIGDDDEQRRDAATMALVRHGVTAADQLVNGLEKGNVLVRRNAAKALWLIAKRTMLGRGLQETLPQLRTALKDNDKMVSDYAALALSRIYKPSRPTRDNPAYPVLENILHNADGMMQREAASSLAKTWAVPELAKGLSAKKVSARLAAAHGLMHIGSMGRGALPQWLPLLVDDNKHLRRDAVHTCIYFKNGGGIDKAIAYLKDRLGDDDPAIRIRAVSTLGAFGPHAQPAIPALRELQKDQDKMVRLTVGEVLPWLESSNQVIRDRFNDKTPLDPQNNSLRQRIHSVKLLAGKTYRIDAVGKSFDVRLAVENSENKRLAADDNSGEGNNAALYFVPSETGVYRIVVAANKSATGDYELTVRGIE